MHFKDATKSIVPVEKWIISAVSSGLMSAKMDQLSQVVMVEQCVVRSFGMGEWKVLQARLHGWKKNVRNISKRPLPPLYLCNISLHLSKVYRVGCA
jgi:hypothetical protein